MKDTTTNVLKTKAHNSNGLNFSYFLQLYGVNISHNIHDNNTDRNSDAGYFICVHTPYSPIYTIYAVGIKTYKNIQTNALSNFVISFITSDDTNHNTVVGTKI